VRDEHEGALQRHRELRQSLPWRAAPFTTAAMGLAEAVPPLQQGAPPRGSSHLGRTPHARSPAHRLLDVSASPHIQELQKLLVDVLREVGTATDPTHKLVAEEMLAQVRAQILSAKMAEESQHQGHSRPQNLASDSCTDLGSSKDDADDDAAPGLSGSEPLDSWLVAQQQAQMEQMSRAARVEPSTRSPSGPRRVGLIAASAGAAPRAISRRNSGGGALAARDGNSTGQLQRSGRRGLRRQQHDGQPPPSRELREKLSLELARATALEREQERNRRQADRMREAAVAASRRKPASGWAFGLVERPIC
jgi:hypothetical protein